ncbi:hypothetical protein I3842_04G125700 [Carya illinoinensis]|uniref:Uncharacterized protein n=1 Tax=Carya illinoinensis TaxID=32201 RepID=A0A922F870_CARIL|nr:hypothetical protein I3842_04G125700 [Carya illinoinensis]
MACGFPAPSNSFVCFYFPPILKTRIYNFSSCNLLFFHVFLIYVISFVLEKFKKKKYIVCGLMSIEYALYFVLNGISGLFYFALDRVVRLSLRLWICGDMQLGLDHVSIIVY